MTRPSTPFLHTSLLALALCSIACNRSPLHDMGSAGDDADSADGAPVAELVSEFAGVWLGSAEDPLAVLEGASDAPPLYRFPSGSSRIRLELSDIAEYPFLDGTLTFGEGTPPEPATDATRGYPIDPTFTAERVIREIDGSVRPPWEGFAYRVRPEQSWRELEAAGVRPNEEFEALSEGRAFDGKLDIGYSSTQLYASWCELQTANSCDFDGQQVGMNTEQNTCSLGFGQNPQPIDCQKMALCASEVCACYSDTCSNSPDPFSLLTLRLSETGLVGVFNNAVVLNERGFQQPLGLVRFYRESDTRR
ncbi:MAG TPA: hypothetical protein VMG12_10355 [Polyangiaceae bacterium]|nr:hypothetical protein [Polyangiaceae bacterium]